MAKDTDIDTDSGTTSASTSASTQAASATTKPGEIEAIVGAYHGQPGTVLGPRLVSIDGKKQFAIRVFRPLDAAVDVMDVDSDERTPMLRVHDAGFFEAVFPLHAEPFAYRLLVSDLEGNEYEIEDCYRFAPQLTAYDLHLFGEGNLLYSYDKLGAHFHTIDDVKGVTFAVWAPNAQRVSVVGEFNGWDTRAHPMHFHEGPGVWELFIPNLPQGTYYKYAIRSRFMGYEVDKTDPYGFFAALRPSTDSRVWDIDQYVWNDDEWLEQRAERQAVDQPINIYELHLGSWRTVPAEEGGGFLDYRDLAHEIVDYVKQMGYTHIELLPITEFPFDGSWGYQATGYFAPTSRFGTPDDFMYFVDHCHQNGIGVLLDWVPAHFPRDAHGLAYFDGTHLYEHADPRLGEHLDWGTKIFNFGRNEVRNFLLSSALFWLKKYHLDGLRVDAVASMLYLDYSRENSDWLPNKYGGRENLAAIDFIRRFNEITHGEVPGIMTVAEESTSWPMVTRPTYMGGLGFDFKWNMGWMHDMLSYMEKDPIHRRYHQNQVTFSLMYAFSENFILPFSHDEVVHLKKSMLDKMPGDLWQKFANLRALYGYMYSHPGKKLLFMGGEFGQWTEWSEAKSLDWHLLEYEDHQEFNAFVRDLNHLYLWEPALHEVDASWEGFQWIDLSDSDQSVISFVRRGADPSQQIVVVCNFTPVPRPGYRVGLPVDGVYSQILNSDDKQYGGSGYGYRGDIGADATPWQHCAFSAQIDLPPLGVLYLKPNGR